ncbi:toll/interleukin-1 receptor domain-containing protein [Geodermatophilus nigrescens]
MRIVISYAREDRAVVDELCDTLRSLGHEPWTDAGAHSGGRWWDEIIGRIQQCDVLLAVTSPASLASKACTLERQYALALDRQLFPVLVAPVSMQGLPSASAQVHFFDYTVRDGPATARLAQSLGQLPRSRPLPHPLPPPPPPPLSYLNLIADRIATLVADPHLQERMVTDLTTGLRASDPEEKATAADLLRRFIEHENSLQGPAERARHALSGAPRQRPAWQGWQAGPPQPGRVARSRVTKVLAWIGGATVGLVALGVWAAVSLGGDTPGGNGGGGSGVVPAATVSRSVHDDLVSRGHQPGTVTCGDLEATVDATTYCSATGLPNGGTNVRVTVVQGGNVVGWDYPN